jgi:hypothetical protein
MGTYISPHTLTRKLCSQFESLPQHYEFGDKLSTRPKPIDYDELHKDSIWMETCAHASKIIVMTLYLKTSKLLQV